MSDAVSRLRDPRTIRERATRLLTRIERGQSAWFTFDPAGLERAAEATLAVARRRFPDPAAIPLHARWRHFAPDGTDRFAPLLPRLSTLAPRERARRMIDLAVVSVLLDAGAGPDWSWREPGSANRFARSEGLALASLDMFARGAFSRDATDPLRVDAERLVRFTAGDLAVGFQVRAHNPLAGLDGRAGLLQRLGTVGLDRPGDLLDLIAPPAVKEIPATALLSAILERLGAIWPSRLTLDGVALGDVWRHDAVRTDDATEGYVPFHKLSQWLAYSLVEPLLEAGVAVRDLDALTGLPEYRNGGLLIDHGALVPRRPELLRDSFAPADEPIVEWRAATVVLLDRIAMLARERLGLDAVSLPLAKILEGGTWVAGREIARERRPDGGPPIRVQSDGTVF